MEDVEAPVNYSIVLGDDDGGGRGATRALNLLYRSSGLVVRSRSRARVVDGLLAYLSDFLPRPEGFLVTDALGVVSNGSAVLIPRFILSMLKQAQPRFNRVGLQFVDTPVSTIDPASRELVVPPPALEADAAALEGLDRRPPAGSEIAAVEPGRYALKAWAFLAQAESFEQMTRAKAVAATIASVAGDRDTLSDALHTLGDLFTTVQPVGVPSARPQDVVDQLRPIVRT